MWFVFKVILSAIIIAFVSWLSGRKPVLAGFIIALPLMSMLAILFSYLEYKDMDKINRFTLSIIVAVPLSLTFFIPFLANQWFKMSFPLTYCLAVIFLVISFFLHRLFL